jgi:hypothetical protein
VVREKNSVLRCAAVYSQPPPSGKVGEGGQLAAGWPAYIWRVLALGANNAICLGSRDGTVATAVHEPIAAYMGCCPLFTPVALRTAIMGDGFLPSQGQ